MMLSYIHKQGKLHQLQLCDTETIFVWLLNDTSLECHMAKLHEKQWRCWQDRQVYINLWDADHDIITTFCVGGCKVCSITFDCCTVEDNRTEMTILKGWGQERSNTVFSASNHASGKCFQIPICSNTSHIVHLENDEYDVEDIGAYTTWKCGKKWWPECTSTCVCLTHTYTHTHTHTHKWIEVKFN